MKAHMIRFFVFALLGSFVLLHLFLLSKTFLLDGAGNMRTAVAGYGDIPFHFQAWDFDSNKILVYSQFFIVPLIIAL